MSDLYAPPKSQVSDVAMSVKEPNVIWKIFFVICVLLNLIVAPFLIMSFIGADYVDLDFNAGALDYFDWLIQCVMLAGLFGYAFSKRIGMQKLWKAALPVYVVWFVSYAFILPFGFGVYQFNEPPALDWTLVIDPLFTLAVAQAIYLYGFSSDHLWREQ
ncbi:hypothetical protein HCH_00721 [Hahella chejuensis KCTC 2396]|uniref:Uncharacterized protein n=1 Tax=Hahella chejuensis (strain KCTC 2396) TaxID=349521 RepID=Q2SP05_HAHCH|nr:hypothetical protein [Hahella chejuensis]ABC27619.1 hypothetical protein HCH_00721 [Hahella chejuensis KCTC 2396]